MKKFFNTSKVYRFDAKWSNLVRLIFTAFLAILFTSPNVHASEASLNSILGAYQRGGTTIGVAVYDVKSSKLLFESNAKKPMNPASTMKVVTSTAALAYLGGNYEYKTLLATDSFSQGAIHNLHVKGEGDPSLVEERLWRIIKDLRVRGVRKITGDIVIDNTYFDGFAFAGKEGTNNTRAYNAFISPLAVNFNSFAVVATNDGSGTVSASIDPPTSYFEFSSSIKGAGDSITIARDFRNGKEIVSASGGVSTEKTKYANVSDPVQYAGTTISWLLDQMEIEFHGKIVEGSSAGKKKLVLDKSKPLSLILRDLNKFSNNFTAEMILKTIAAVKAGIPGSTDKGAEILRNFVTGLGVSSDEFEIHNGSGLSRNNRVSPNTLNQALLYAYQKTKIRTDLMSSFAIAATDGTLKNRLHSPNLAGNVRAKTGTLNDVCALAGYIETKSKSMLAFAILVNGPGAGSGGFFSLQEKILEDLYQNY